MKGTHTALTLSAGKNEEENSVAFFLSWTWNDWVRADKAVNCELHPIRTSFMSPKMIQCPASVISMQIVSKLTTVLSGVKYRCHQLHNVCTIFASPAPDTVCNVQCHSRWPDSWPGPGPTKQHTNESNGVPYLYFNFSICPAWGGPTDPNVVCTSVSQFTLSAFAGLVFCKIFLRNNLNKSRFLFCIFLQIWH